MKLHLKLSTEPITAWNCEYQAYCGAVVPNAIVTFMVDCVLMDSKRFREEFLKYRGACGKCSELAGVGRYLYAISGGQEAMSSEENSGGGA